MSWEIAFTVLIVLALAWFISRLFVYLERIAEATERAVNWTSPPSKFSHQPSAFARLGVPHQQHHHPGYGSPPPIPTPNQPPSHSTAYPSPPQRK